MFSLFWRRDGRKPSLLAIICLTVFVATGCSHPPQMPAARRYVRMDALLSLHPSWTQVTSLDQELQRLHAAPAQVGALHYDPLPSPPNFTPGEISSKNLAAERDKQVTRDTARYFDSLSKSQDAQNQSIMALMARREKKRVDTEVAQRLAEEERSLRDLNEVKAFSIRQQIRSLTFSDLVVQSRILDLSQGVLTDTTPLKQAQLEHSSYLSVIERLKAENRDLLTEDFLAAAAKKREAFYREAQKNSQDRMNKRLESLERDKQEKISEAKNKQKDTAIPEPAKPELPPADPHVTALPLPPDTIQNTALPSAQAKVVAALDRQRVIWQTQRSSLVAEIRSDTEKAAQQIAAEHGWVLVRQGDPRALDSTAEVADALRAQWRPGASK